MSQTVSFNLNEYVRVKVLASGFEAWHAHYKYMPPQYRPSLASLLEKADEQGYCKFQLWEFMQVFGPSIHLSVAGLFETDILLSKKDLKPTS